MVHTFYLEEYTERKEKMQVYLIEIDVQEPEYLDHFFLDSSEYTAYPNEGEVVVSEYNVYKCREIKVVEHSPEVMGYIRYILEPQSHSKYDWVNLE